MPTWPGTAFFGASNITSLSFPLVNHPLNCVGGWTFNAVRVAYTLHQHTNIILLFDGAGIVVNGGSATITNNVHMIFNSSSSTAGSATITNNAYQNFNNSSTVGSATFTNNFIVDVHNTPRQQRHHRQRGYLISTEPAQPAAPPSPTTSSGDLAFERRPRPAMP